MRIDAGSGRRAEEQVLGPDHGVRGSFTIRDDLQLEAAAHEARGEPPVGLWLAGAMHLARDDVAGADEPCDEGGVGEPEHLFRPALLHDAARRP